MVKRALRAFFTDTFYSPQYLLAALPNAPCPCIHPVNKLKNLQVLCIINHTPNLSD
jgi:hypothetical protein